MNYICKICNFSAKYKSEYYKHLNTKSHIIIFNKNEKIKETRRKNKLKKEEKIITELKYIGKKIDQNEIKTNKKLEKIAKTQDKIEKTQKETNKGVKKITDYIDFLNKYCIDATPLSILTKKDVDKLIGISKYQNFEFEESIVKYIKLNRLHIKIGNIIMANFLKPNNLTKQQIWTSDISRLIYLIIQMIGNEKNWVRDKKGELFAELIILPVLNRIRYKILKYSNYYLNKYNSNLLENEEILNTLEYTNKLLDTSYNEYIIKETLKYMAGKFSVNIKKNEILNNL